MCPESSSSVKTDSQPNEHSINSRVVAFGKCLAIAFVIAMVFVTVQVFQNVDTNSIFLGLDGLRMPLSIVGCIIIAGAIFIAWARPRFISVVKVIAVLLLVGFVGTKLVRVDSFYGNMLPKLNWAWAPLPLESYANFDIATAAPTNLSEPSNIVVTPSDFPGFLGANRDGHVMNVGLADSWDEHQPELLWRKPIGVGWAGFAVVGDVSITQEQRGEFETVVAYDAVTGKELWVHGDELRFRDLHGDGPRAVPTVDESRVYTIGATGLLNCIDIATGEHLWSRQTLVDPDKNNLLWGMCGSPLIHDRQVIVCPGGGSGQAIKAYDKFTGELIFESGDDQSAYSSVTSETIVDQQQYLSFNGEGLRAYSMDGQPLWLFPWLTQGEQQRTNVAQPVVVRSADDLAGDGTLILVSSGYGSGTALIRVTKDQTSQWSVEQVWHSRKMKSKMSNFVELDGYIYGLDNGIFTCLDVTTGDRMWKGGRYGHGQVLAAGELLLVQRESGEVVLLRANPEKWEQVGSLAGLSDKTWNNLALAGDLLVIRNDREAACYRLPIENDSRDYAVAINNSEGNHQ